MRKLICLILALAVAILPVFADIIWEPYNDPFYDRHREEFTFCREVYETAFAVDALREPYGEKVCTIPEGEAINGEHIYTGEDGVTWILSDYMLDGDWKTIYVRADQVVNRYDREFLQDFGAELAAEPPEGIGAITIQEGFLFWTYPGGLPWEGAGSLVELDAAEVCQWYYTDPQGDVWGYVDYHFGRHESWICLTAMTDPDRPGATIPEELQPKIPEQQTAEEKKGMQPIIFLPIAVAVGASVMLLLWPKKKKEN